MENVAEFLKTMVSEPIAEFGRSIAAFLPVLLGAALLVLIGAVAGWGVKYAVAYALRLLKVDDVAIRDGVAQVLARGGIKEPVSQLTGRVAGYMIVFCFFMIALGTLHIRAADVLLENFFLYLPNVFAAALVLSAGYLAANFFARAALISAVNNGFKSAPLISRGVRIAILFFAVSITMELLGIGKAIVQTTFTLLLGGIVLALALAFGLGGRDIARDYLEKRLKRIPEKDSWEDIDHV